MTQRRIMDGEVGSRAPGMTAAVVITTVVVVRDALNACGLKLVQISPRHCRCESAWDG